MPPSGAAARMARMTARARQSAAARRQRLPDYQRQEGEPS
jgi:hypothetical protein